MTRDVSAERHVATLAALNLACGLTMGLLAGLMLVATVGSKDLNERAYLAFVSVFFALLGGVNGVIWRGLRLYSPSARLIQLAVGVVSLAGPPLGTAWGVYVLWTLLRARGRALFAPEYRKARFEQPLTPEPTAYRPVVAVGVVVGLLITGAGLFAAGQEFALLLEAQRAEAAAFEQGAIDAAIDAWRSEHADPFGLSPADTDAILEQIRDADRERGRR